METNHNIPQSHSQASIHDGSLGMRLDVLMPSHEVHAAISEEEGSDTLHTLGPRDDSHR